MANRCELDLNKQTLKLNDELVPLIKGQLQANALRAFHVRVREPLILKLDTETLVSCKVEGTGFSGTGVVEAHSTLPKGVIIGRTLIDATRPSFHVLLANLSDKPVRPHGNAFVGMCEPVEVIETPVSEEIEASNGQPPGHVQELLDDITPDQACSEREQVRNL